jgi:TolB protein
MKALWRSVGVAAVMGLAACDGFEFPDEGGGGPGGNVECITGFAFVRAADRNLYVKDDAWDSSSKLQLTTTGNVRNPSVSRDGTQVVFVHQVSSSVSELQRVNISTDATTGTRAVSTVFSSDDPQCNGCGALRYPTFSPNGGFIIFSVDQGSLSRLARVNADGSGFQFLTQGPLSYGAPSFHPNGTQVLAPTGNSPSQLTQLQWVSINGGSAGNVTNNLGNEVLGIQTRAVVSPDGSQVAFDGRLSNGGARIFVAPLSPSFGMPVRVTDYTGSDAGAQDSFPSWRSNTQLGFFSNAGGSENIYSISASTQRGTGALQVPSATEPMYRSGTCL